MANDIPPSNGEHDDDFAYQPLDVKKGGNMANGLRSRNESYSNTRMMCHKHP